MVPGDSRLRIGASSWSAPSWEGVFYPPGTPPSDYLAHYASRYDTVEVDATDGELVFSKVAVPATVA